ncbi:MAG: TfoX/Sxy family protein [Pseudomonadota bacterium]
MSAPLTKEEIEAQAAILRDALTGLPGITEQRMFGGLCFLLNGNMLCGSWKHGGMFRVGKEREAAARAEPGVGEMTATGRRMSGLVQVDPAVLEDDAARGRLLAHAIAFVGALPAKKPDARQT